MGLKPLEPKQNSLNASGQQGLPERAGGNSAGYPQTQGLTQPIAPNLIQAPQQTGRVQGPQQNSISPAANDKALFSYGAALNRLHSGKRHGHKVAGYAEIPNVDDWYQNSQLSNPTSAAAKVHFTSGALSANNAGPSVYASLEPRRRDPGSTRVKGGVLQIKV